MRVLLLSLFVALSVAVSGQETYLIKLDYPIWENANLAKSLTVIDVRQDKDLGSITQRGVKTLFSLPEDLEAHFNERFERATKKKGKGTNEIVVLLEELKIYDEPAEKFSYGRASLKLSSFLKKDNKYYFIDRRIKNFRVNPRETPNVPRNIYMYVSIEFMRLIEKSYLAEIVDVALNEDDLRDYETILKDKMPITNSENLKDGIYLDARSFATQNPKEGYELVKNSNGEVVRAIKGEERVNKSKIYAYTESGKTFLNTASGFMEINKDEKGYFIYTNRGYLFPATANNIYGGGLIGALASNIEKNAKNKKMQKEERYNIYIDPLTGELYFEK